MTSTVQVTLDSVSKEYFDHRLSVRALNDVTLFVSRGEFVVFAGPSGSGKSTLLHIMGGLDRPSRGEATVCGFSLAQLSLRELARFRLYQIGFVFQAYNLVPVLSALENVEYPLLLQGVPKKDRDARSRELLMRVGLADCARRRPNELSGGQQQRVAVARALVTRPELVLADEPTANLDSKTGEGLVELFRELNRDLKTTFICASHDPMVIARAGRVIRLKDGRIVSSEGAL